MLQRVQGLNVNGRRGTTTEIRLRLRPQRAPDSFLPFENVLGTMLHEITHNVQGPHDATFYKILDEVTKDCEDFMAKGISGTGIGFDGPSQGRLGAHGFIPMHNPLDIKAAQLRCATFSVLLPSHAADRDCDASFEQRYCHPGCHRRDEHQQISTRDAC